jgi:hypothetical protein
VARRNAAELDLGQHVRFLRGDWFDAIPGEDRFEVIVSNPPYIADVEKNSLPRDVRDHEPPMALFAGPTGLEALRSIIDDAPSHLVGNGLLALELAEARAMRLRAWLKRPRLAAGVVARRSGGTSHPPGASPTAGHRARPSGARTSQDTNSEAPRADNLVAPGRLTPVVRPALEVSCTTNDRGSNMRRSSIRLGTPSE